MRPNPFEDILTFVTQAAWPTAVFWLLIVLSALIALMIWRRDPMQRTGAHVGRWLLRVAVGSMWWQQSLWKIPPNFDGLRFWMQNMVDHGAIPLQSQLVGSLVIPNMPVFGPLVYALEVVIGVSLILGLLTRAGAALGALMALNLWLGLYSAPNEWPWTYAFLVIIQIGYFIDPPGRSLGLDATRKIS